jgi:hypothetical protein
MTGPDSAENTSAELQSLIDRTAAAVSASYDSCKALDAYCMQHYGFTPEEIDCDPVIDAVLGGSGPAPGMTAEEFDRHMRESARGRGVTLKETTL